MLLAVGGHVLGDLTDREKRMASGFAGGMGSSHEGLCGAFTAGVMVIGAVHGRVDPEEDDTRCQELVLKFRDSFRGRFSTLNCGELRQEDYGSGGREPCSVLVERAAQLLLDILETHNQPGEPA